MKDIAEWGIEVGLIIIHFPSNLLKPFIKLDTVNQHATEKYPIVLVERWFSRNPFHLFAKKYLENKGYKVFSLNYPMTKGTFEDSAKNLQKFIKTHNISNAILVGISGGATTCLEYLQNMDGWDKTHKFISVSGSLHGSPLARIFPTLSSMKQLVPNSAYMKQLFAQEVKHKGKIITISAKRDNMVPGKFSRLEGAQNITLDVVGHNLLHTFWLPTYRLIAKLSKQD